jgi:hypothetical protein
VTDNAKAGSLFQRIADIHWRILLPLAMVVLSASLMLVTRRQEHMFLKMGTGWEPPARVVNAIINGPGFYFGRRLIPIPIPTAINEALSYDGDRLLGVAFFWFSIGLAIERHLKKQALDSHYPMRAAVFFALAWLICGALMYGGIAFVFCPSPNMTCSEQVVKTAPTVLGLVARYLLRLQHTMVLSVSLWLFFFCGYFAKRTFAAVKRSLAHA